MVYLPPLTEFYSLPEPEDKSLTAAKRSASVLTDYCSECDQFSSSSASTRSLSPSPSSSPNMDPVISEESTKGRVSVKGFPDPVLLNHSANAKYSDPTDRDKTRGTKPNSDLGSASTNTDTNVFLLPHVRVNRHKDNIITVTTLSDPALTTAPSTAVTSYPFPAMISVPPLIWSWPHEHADRRREREADETLHGRHGATHYIYGSNSMPFEVDRRLLKDLVKEKMGEEVGRIEFLSAGTFHKAYLVTLSSHRPLVARVARRFMPRLKTSSEVATIAYLRERSKVPVPHVFHWDPNPYNRLGGEFIFLQKASGVPLSKVYHGLSYTELLGLLRNLAALIIPLFAHRFDAIGSLYHSPASDTQIPAKTLKQAQMTSSSEAPTPKPPFSFPRDVLSFAPSFTNNGGITPKPINIQNPAQEFRVGQIISWPFFGSNRGELNHPTEINRGPWSTTSSYLSSCADREISSVIMENEGRCAPHKLHLDPDEIRSSRYHRLRKVDGDESDESDEWGLDESDEDEWEGPGDLRYDYGDYRRMQRSAFLVSVLSEREEMVRKEMGRWVNIMERLRGLIEKENEEEFALDCHDLSLENVFVDEKDHTKITCVIDWESTTTRPLWAAAHLPAFIQSSPFVAKLFRRIVANLAFDSSLSQGITLPSAYIAKHSSSSSTPPLAALCAEWLYYESRGVRLRMVHRCAEWDGWEEGLVDSFLGSEEDEDVWFKGFGDEEEVDDDEGDDTVPELTTEESRRCMPFSPPVRPPMLATHLATAAMVRVPVPIKRHLSFAAPAAGPGLMPLSLLDSTERAKEKMLDVTGDICGGRGGELGRRLEAWLCVNGGERDD